MNTPNMTEECDECHGTGWLFINDVNRYNEKIVRRQKCRKCGGEGCIIAQRDD